MRRLLTVLMVARRRGERTDGRTDGRRTDELSLHPPCKLRCWRPLLSYHGIAEN